MRNTLTGIVTLALAIGLIVVMILPAAGQYPGGSNAHNWNTISRWVGGQATPRLTIDVENVPLKDAVKKLFEGTFGPVTCDESGLRCKLKPSPEYGVTVGYRIDPLLQKPPFDKLEVSIHAQNADFAQVFAKLLDSNGLEVHIDPDGAIAIGPPPSVTVKSNQPPTGSSSGALRPNSAQTMGPYGASVGRNTPGLEAAGSCAQQTGVSKRIPASTVKDAVAAIEPGWTFKDAFGSRYMQGASFYNFPKDMAVSMLLIAAGLKPPAAGTKVVSQELKGKSMSLSDLYQWTPPNPSVQSYGGFGGGLGGGGYGYGGGGGGGGRSGSGGGGGGFGGQSAGSFVVQDESSANLAIGAYRRVSPKGESNWLFTVLAGQVLDITLIDKLMAASGVSYTMADLTQRPIYTTITQALANGQTVKTQQVTFRGPQVVSVQLYDVSLDQALQSILPMVQLKYHKEGAGNPTYVIEPSAAPNTGKPEGSYGSPGGRIGF